jgi:Haem-binding domain
LKKYLRWLGIAIVVLLCAFQFVRPDKTNPAADQSMSIDVQSGITSPVATLIRTSCFDCHSNETRWPWYSHIAPVSWLVAHDVRAGRNHLNFSEWGEYAKSKRVLKLGQIYEQVSKDEMPITKYLYMHPDARLSAADRDSIMSWTEQEEDRLTGGN